MAKQITLEHVSAQVTRMDGRFDELIDFIKDQVAMKSEVQDVRNEVMELRNKVQDARQEVAGVRNEVLTVADQVTKLQETVEIELVAPTRRMDRLERRMTVVERKLGLAT